MLFFNVSSIPDTVCGVHGVRCGVLGVVGAGGAGGCRGGLREGYAFFTIKKCTST